MKDLTVFENELVPVYITDKGECVVYGRELWEVLRVKSKFADWIKNRFQECEAIENEDFEAFSKILENGGKSKEYIIKLDTAKEMAMLERNEIGKSVRKYFIKVDKKAKQQKLIIPQGKELLALALIEANTMLEKAEAENIKLQAKIEEDEPKVLLAKAISVSNTCILVREFVKILNQNGINTGEKRFYNWLKNNGYLIKKEGSDCNTPTQKSMDLKLFELKETPIFTNNSGVKIVSTPYITAKGQQYFIRKFLEKKKQEEQLTL